VSILTFRTRKRVKKRRKSTGQNRSPKKAVVNFNAEHTNVLQGFVHLILYPDLYRSDRRPIPSLLRGIPGRQQGNWRFNVQSVAVEWEDPLIWRWDRRRAVTVQASPHEATAPTLMQDARAAFEAIELPPGYSLEFDGEYGSTRDSQEALVPGIVPAIAIILLIIVVLFNAYRPPLIIVLIIPFAVVGIPIGLLVTGAPFGVMALLGAMSLAGTIIKNVVVLLDQVNINIEEGMSPYDGVIESAVSRLKPVVNATATTVLGIMPLLQDIFWVSMAVTIMFGLAFATVF